MATAPQSPVPGRPRPVLEPKLKEPDSFELPKTALVRDRPVSAFAGIKAVLHGLKPAS